ncbi:adenylosuccinate synthetase-like [Oppia nitens]|uniref:adenylosuccinate synthetase-like n=1 Tax=Oppia nitens TaxID=1686743 RepID=UPI0023DBF89A|nr:adenylosuccinate synthetase-like [Oppia nitens]
MSNIDNNRKLINNNMNESNNQCTVGSKASVVLGAQWGDEGKGKIVDLLSTDADICCRCQAGNNSGHTVVVGDNDIYVFHMLPCGYTNQKCTAVLGNGCVIHLKQLIDEIYENQSKIKLNDLNNNWKHRLLISDRAHIVFDFHQTIDGLQELRKGSNSIGTTKMGIGPTYTTKVSRIGIRMADLIADDFSHFENKFRSLFQNLKSNYPSLSQELFDAELSKYKKYADVIRPCVTDTVLYLNSQLRAGRRIVIEGANAAILDIDFGTYPYVTSSNCTIGGVCTGLGIPTQQLGNVYGIVKAYTTRLGGGPFPTELTDHWGDYLKMNGNELSTTTGCRRRCGWLDVVLVRYSNIINGYTALAITKLDIMDKFPEIKIAVSYQLDGKEFTHSLPAISSDLAKVKVKYITLDGWQTSTGSVRNFADLPDNAQHYVLTIQKLVGVPVKWVSVGPKRGDTIKLF